MEEWFFVKTQGTIIFRQDSIRINKLTELDEILNLLEYVMIIVV